MAKARSQTAVVNLAFAKLGTQSRILALDDGTPLAKAASAVYQPALETVLAAHPWNFACRRDKIPADVAAPSFDYGYRYTLPADCLRWLPPERHSDGWFEGIEEGGGILTDYEPPLPLRYIYLNEDPNSWSAGFVQALACRIGLDLAFGVTALAEMTGLKERHYLAELREAKRQDGQASPSRSRAENAYSWLDDRN